MGGEFMSWGFNLFYEENGIKRQYTPTYYPQQNSVAKRKNWTVIEMGRNLLTSKGLPNTIWASAIGIFVYLLNISPIRNMENMTHYEAFGSMNPMVKHIKVFRCIGFSLIHSHKLQKLDPKLVKCIFVGYCAASKAYKLYNSITGGVVVSRDVYFHEGARWNWRTDTKREPRVMLKDSGESHT